MNYKRVLHLRPEVFALLSGIAVSLGTNLATTVVLQEDGHTAQWKLILSILLTLISATMFLKASLSLGDVREQLSLMGQRWTSRDFDELLKDPRRSSEIILRLLGGLAALVLAVLVLS
ncbi:MAG TPA: hypothetical protein VFI25_09140 [Planctomycetota bacterium]|jgi:hypothetical protein|nr:hypothetical protein [Planctomycetota bacterium]